MKRVFALLLTLAMLLGLMPTAIAAEAEQAASSTTVQATELPGVSRLDDMERSEGRQPAAQPLYSDDDIVTVIVQLDGPSLLDYYNQMGGQAFFGADGSSDEAYTAGEAVSAFLDLPEVQDIKDELLAGQQSFLSQIGGPRAATLSAARSAEPEVEVVAQWTTVLNGMAIRVPYGSLADIKAMDGVQRAYVQHVYEAPEPVTEGAGAAGFSYDMVDLSAAWGAGYTGKGMLVAVIDTGLDLEYSSFSVDYPDGSWQNVTDIRRTHEAFRENSFKTEFADSELRYTRETISAFLREHTLQAHKIIATSPIAVNGAAYKNRKVVYAFDYIGEQYSTDLYGDVNVYPGQFGNTHGTHVAGTVAGYAETEEGEVIFSGIAPDAQLAIMKVFPDQNGGAPETATMCALEDAMILGADVVNLSLGSDNGYADDDSAQAQIYASVAEAGVIIMAAAGNSAYSSTGNERGGYNLSSDPEIAMVGSPSVYPSTLSIASINNTVTSQMTLVWSDGENEYKIPFTDPFDDEMKTDFSEANMPEGGYEIVPVGGTGTYQDYSDAGFRSGYYGYGDPGKTGIALVQRGEISFVEKIKNAQSFKWQNYQQGQMVQGGVRAVFIYDNVEGELINMSISSTDYVTMTSAFISKEAGEAMIAAINDGKTVTLKWVNQEDEIADYAGGYEMSSFTSWGAAPGLELKPEITAPGGNIWSTVIDQTYKIGAGYYNDYVGAYEMMSGTSMATPHMTGLGALVRQYVQTEGLASGADAAVLTNQLLVSTAVPQNQKGSTAYYSPRRQGAGLVNIGAAITTPAYITVDGQMVGKLELKDDPNWTGSYDLEFTVHNLTEFPVAYNVQAVMQRPDTKTENGHTLMLDSDVLIKTVDLASIIIPANGEVTVSKTITLTADEIDELKELFPNGTYIEGFITLNGARVPQIGLPYLAFLGDWTAAPIFDSALWCDEAPDDPDWNPYDNGDYTWWPSVVGSTVYNEMYGTVGVYNLGQNPFESVTGDPVLIYRKGNFAISPNGDEYFDRVDDIELYQLRDAKLIVVEVRDAGTEELYYRDFSTYNFKTLYDSSHSAAIPSTLYYFTPTAWVGTDLDGNLLPSGTRCIYTITAYGEGEYGDKVEYEGYDYPVTNFEGVDPNDPSTEPTFNGHPMDKTGDVISFPVVVDYEAPKLVNSAISIETREDGHTYLTGTVHDADGSIASVEVVPVVTMTRTYNGTTESSTSADLSYPFYSELIYDEAVQEWKFEADVTEYTRPSYPGYMTYEWTGAVHIYCGDYGANDRTYMVAVKGMDTPGELLLSHTSAKLHPGSAFDMSVTDNTGSGLPIIRSSTDPEVATVDEFGTVTAVAPGQTTIVVTNGVKTAYCVVAVEEWPTEVIDFDLSMEYFPGLKPNGVFMVKVTNLQPADVILTEKGWQVFEDDPDLYVGLVTCEKYGADGLSAWIHLNYAATDDPDVKVPGAGGTLKVTLNGVVREMKFDWEDLYTYYSTYGSGQKDEDLVSAANSEEQTVYVTVGETATLVAKYNDSSAHNVHPVELFGAQKRDENGQVTEYYPESVGLVLDGKPYGASSSSWTGKLVTKAGYTLPEQITISERRPDASEPGGYYEYTRWDSGSSYDTYSHSYNKETGEVFVRYMPTGNASLVIRADGVASEGAPAGEVSGTEYEMPDGLYGPFNWAMTTGLPEGVTSAGGTLEPFENGLINSYNTGNGAHFTPDKPGVSYITASSKDGQYSVNFAVVCEPVKADKLDLDEHRLELEAGDDPVKLTATLTPEPTLDVDKKLIWTSFNPDVATVDQDGNVTAVSEGYAYIKVAVEMDTTVSSYCVVQVGAAPEVKLNTISYNLNGGRISDSAPKGYVTIDKAQTLSIPEPTKANSTFLGWIYTGQTTPTKTVTLPAGFSGTLTLTANWEENFTPDVPDVPEVPDIPSIDTPAPPSSDSVTTSDKQEDDVTITETTATPGSTTQDGSASAAVSDAMGDEIVKQAVSNESETVVIAPEMDDTVTSAEVSIPADTVSELAEKTEADVRIETPVATVVIPNEALADLAAEGGQVAVSAQRTDDNTVEVTVKANGQPVDSVTGGMMVTVPQEDCGPGTVAMLVFEDGTTQVIRQSIASADGQSIDIPLDGSAKVMIVDNSQTFTDVSDSNWAADAIAFASSHELMNGVGGGAFDPKSPMTRGMLAMVLHNLENNQDADTSTVFSDVRDDAWYSDAVQWAAGKGIVNGYPDGSFAPKESISREQLAVMLYRYAGSPEASGAALEFTDADAISGYAKEAMAWAVENHILQGKGNGVLDPKGDATRAETAQMLLNFMVNVK